MEEDWSGCYRFLPWYKSFYSNLSLLRYGGFAGAMKDTLSSFGLELHSRAVAGSGKASWVVGIHHLDYLLPGFLSLLDFKLRCVNEIQESLNGWLESGRRTLVYSLWKSCVRHGWDISPEEPAEPAVVVVSAVVLLSLVYQYLAGNVGRGGSRAYYSRSSLDFRDIYVAIVLFLGAYVWIKFREAAPKGVYPRRLPDKRGGSKVVYDARLTPPMWNGQKVRKLELGRFTTPQEAHKKFLIAAFYYNRVAGLLDGWFPVPPMSEKEQSFSGEEKRAWVIGQSKKVYKEFLKTNEEADLLLQEWLEVWDNQVMPEQDEGNVDFPMTSLLNLVEHQQPALASQVENSGIGMAMLGGSHGLECASHSFDGLHEGLALPHGHSLGSQEGPALPVSQLPPNTESGMSLNGSDQLDLYQTLVHTLQQQNYDQQQLIFLYQQQIQEFGAQISRFQNQQGIQQQQLQESRIQNPQRSYQLNPQEQQWQDVNQGVPSIGMEMEQSVNQHNHSRPTTPPPDGGEAKQGI